MHQDIQLYNDKQTGSNKEICELLARQIMSGLPQAQNKLWHGAPVWFLDGNPVAGYDVLKNCVRLLFLEWPIVRRAGPCARRHVQSCRSSLHCRRSNQRR